MLQISDTHQMPVQAAFLAHYDGSVKSIVSFDRLHQILQVCLTSHYFYVSGTTSENTVTTKTTDGSFAYNGDHDQQQRDNADVLMLAVREELRTNGAYLIGNKYYIDIDGAPTRIKGMTTGNTLTR